MEWEGWRSDLGWMKKFRGLDGWVGVLRLLRSWFLFPVCIPVHPLYKDVALSQFPFTSKELLVPKYSIQLL